MLEEVLETLEWNTVEPAAEPSKHASTKSKSKAKYKADKDDISEVLSNRFAGLEVEDYDTDGGTEPAPSTSSRKTTPSRTYDVDVEEDEAEAKFFHIFRLFEDLDHIRTFLQQT